MPLAVYAPTRTAQIEVEWQASHHPTVLPTTSQPPIVLLLGTRNRPNALRIHLVEVVTVLPPVLSIHSQSL